MSTDDLSSHLAESGVTIRSDSEQYSPGDELSSSPSSSNSPVILYKPPTAWSLLRGVAINLVLPFINGMMLGFGELFAHEAAFRLGWGGTKSASSRRILSGRQFGTSIRNGSLGLGPSSSSPFRPRYQTAPIVLGGIGSARSLSIWGWGSGNKTPPAEESTATAAATPELATESAATPTEAAAEAVVESAETAAGSANAGLEALVTPTDIDVASLINAQDILNMPEELGYLHAIGLDYGWGFTSAMQWALEHVHIYTGLGWGASVMATAFLLRIVMFVPQVRSLQFGALMNKMKRDPRSSQAMKLVQSGFQDGNVEARQKGQILNKLLREEYKVSNWGILWGLMQIPFTFGLFRIVSGMVNIPVPALEDAGFLWFTDLTTTDPYFVLPAVGTGLMTLAIIINSKYTPPAQKKMIKPMMYIFGVVGFVGTTFLSSAVNLMTVALGASTLLTSVVLNITAVRRYFELPLAVLDPASSPAGSKVVYEAPRAAGSAAATATATTTTTTATSETPQPRGGVAGMRESLTGSLNDMKKGFSESIGNYTGNYAGTDADKAEKKRKDMIRKLESMRKQQELEDFEKKYKGRK